MFFQLYDVWKLQGSNNERYTWCERNVKSRLDYCFLSQNDIWTVLEYDVKSIISSTSMHRLSDHKAVVIQIEFLTNKLGPGYWKLNTEYLNDTNYIGIVKADIKKTYLRYKQCNSYRLIWEMIKIHIRQISIEYAKTKTQKRYNRQKYIEQKLEDLSVCNKNEYERLKLENELHEIYEFKVRGAQIRSRATWIEQGERSTKYFFKLENKHQVDNTIYKLSDGENMIYDENRLLEHINKFYENLYSSQYPNTDEVKSYIENINVPNILSEKEKEDCDSVINVTELENAVKNMKNNKAPGLDGLPVEFYKIFWTDLKSHLFNAIKESYKCKELCHSMRTAVLSLLFKKGEKHNLANYRPISLCNTDYKILAFSLANRLQKVLPYIINSDQTGYIKNRYIGNNIRLIYDILEYSTKYKKDGALIFLDFAKAFDSLEWKFMFNALKRFNFGKYFIDWIKTLYANPLFTVKNNGWLSSKISMKRGIRQGCPLSGLLFIISVELLAERLRNNTYILGFQFGNTHIKLSQYADDSTLMLSSYQSIENALDEIQNFGKYAGLKLNIHKTQGMLLGNLKYETVKNININWTEQPIKCLGIWFGRSSLVSEYNWDKKLKTMEDKIQIWKQRNLTLFGKVLIIKSMVLSNITLQASVLPIPDTIEKKLNRLIFNYLWSSNEKIKRTVVIRTLNEGGLNVTDIESWFLSLKTAWIPRLYNSGHKWTCIFNYYLSKNGLNTHWLLATNFY